MKSCKTSLVIMTFILVFGAAIVTEAVSPVEPLAKITVEAGEYGRIDIPVSAALEGIVQDPAQSQLMLVEVKGSERVTVPAQIEPEPAKLWWILSGTTGKGDKRVYELVKAEPEEASLIKVVKNDKTLVLQQGDAKILQYNHAIVPAPKDMGKVPEVKRPLYDRSGFIHPLWSPAGAVLTDMHPPDHLHHMGIWMPWTHTLYEGKHVDFWNLGDGTGTVQFTKYLSMTEGPVYGGFSAEHEHIARKTSEGEKVILREVWDVRVYNVGGPEKGYWLIDFKSTQRCVADKPLIQEQYRYGGFGYRAAREWKGKNAKYLTSEGKTRKDGNGTRARWCDTAGAIKGKWAGITHFSNSQNFRHPEPMRIWPDFESNVFFSFTPSPAGDWEMEPGKDFVFQYRLYVHEGTIGVDDAERLWHDYAEPPTVKLEKINP